MDADRYDRELSAQNDYLRRQLEALATKPKVRRRFVEHQVYCTKCGDVLIELVQLDPYPVVRYRRPTSDESPPQRVDFTSMRDFARAYAERKRPIRLESAWQFVPIAAEPADGEDRQFIVTACGCAANRSFTVADIRRRVAEGVKSTAAPPRH